MAAIGPLTRHRHQSDGDAEADLDLASDVLRREIDIEEMFFSVKDGRLRKTSLPCLSVRVRRGLATGPIGPLSSTQLSNDF
jgi:hypothetical protein